ncbi:IniB N-terminal domain-containing protein [Actinomycetospora sp. OC33-EN08]|uniref:IniB N-terminal domain-containing protein n=1 Tax=Actinomycetospora aurantiaca TaxID=3129233 RepID=A0ABU8MR74_9PSEU
MTDTAPGPESLVDWMTGLVSDPVARARFTADPRHELGAQGLADLDPADVAHAMPLVTDVVAARFDAVVEPAAAPAQLAGESAVDALTRHFSAVPTAVAPAADTEGDDWTESLADDLAGAPDGLEGVVSAGPGVDLDLDGTGDLDGVHHDHDLDVMTRLDDDHTLDGDAPDASAAAPTLGFGAPPAPDVPRDAVDAVDPVVVDDPPEEHDLDDHRPGALEADPLDAGGIDLDDHHAGVDHLPDDPVHDLDPTP